MHNDCGDKLSTNSQSKKLANQLGYEKALMRKTTRTGAYSWDLQVRLGD